MARDSLSIMVSDCQTDQVFISDLLPSQHPEIEQALRSALGERLRVIPCTKDIWCRDYMPIQLAPNRFVQFRYDPDYLKGFPHLRTQDAADLLELTKECVRSDLVIDGGNVVRWKHTAILTDKIYRENPTVERQKLRDQLRRLLEIDRPIIIPKEPYEAIGHADGMVRFVDEKTVLVNDYEKVDRAFGTRLNASLRRHGFEMIPFPYFPTEKPGRDPGIGSAVGVYINFLQVEGMIFCPVFGQHEDDGALGMVSKCFPRRQIIAVQCTNLAIGGGGLNCVTWNVVRTTAWEMIKCRFTEVVGVQNGAR